MARKPDLDIMKDLEFFNALLKMAKHNRKRSIQAKSFQYEFIFSHFMLIKHLKKIPKKH